jgi:hypothetical protein
VHYEVDNARVFDPPETAVPIVVSGFGVGRPTGGEDR